MTAAVLAGGCRAPGLGRAPRACSRRRNSGSRARWRPAEPLRSFGATAGARISLPGQRCPASRLPRGNVPRHRGGQPGALCASESPGSLYAPILALEMGRWRHGCSVVGWEQGRCHRGRTDSAWSWCQNTSRRCAGATQEGTGHVCTTTRMYNTYIQHVCTIHAHNVCPWGSLPGLLTLWVAPVMSPMTRSLSTSGSTALVASSLRTSSSMRRRRRTMPMPPWTGITPVTPCPTTTCMLIEIGCLAWR